VLAWILLSNFHFIREAEWLYRHKTNLPKLKIAKFRRAILVNCAIHICDICDTPLIKSISYYSTWLASALQLPKSNKGDAQMKDRYIGKTEHGDLVFQKLDKNGLIAGFETFYVTELVDGTMVMTESSWTHEVTLKTGETWKSGDMPCNLIFPMDAADADLYVVSTFSCDKCGGQHDADAYPNDQTYIIVEECTVLCRDCVTADDVLFPLKSGRDLFKAKNVQGIDLTGYKEIDELFCDSSGWGSPGERALTKAQAEKAAQDLIDTHGEIYAGITGVGQFQVYVTIYKKARKAKKARENKRKAA